MQKQFLVAIFALFSITNFLFSQTPGMIVEPSTGAAALVLDPNSNGYVSATTAGFLGNDQLIANNELPWQTLIPAGSEPNSDVQNGPNCGFTDFVESSVGGIDPVFHLTTGGNWLFRFRMASIAPNAKSYSILVDIDNLIGPGDDCYIPGVNPGFELEIVLATKFGVRIYDHRFPCGSNLIYTYGPERIQKSIAASTVCSQLNFFLETYVSWADITAQFGVTPSTPMRYAIVDNMAADKSTICNPSSASDIGGVDDNACGNLEACFTEIVNLQPPCPPNSISPCIYSACPVISGTPLVVGTTSISGTSTEANGTIIRIYINGDPTPAGSGTVTGGTWTVSGLPPLVTGAQVSATAQAANEVESGTNCNNAQVAGATCTPPVILAQECTPKKGFFGDVGSASPGAIIRVYNSVQVLQTPNAGSIYATGVVTANANGSWVWKCNGNNSCSAGANNCLADGNYFITQQLPGQCESSPVWICIGLSGSPTNTPQITTSITTSTTTVSGTLTNNVAENNGVSIFLYVNGNQIATTTTTNNLGTWIITLPAGTFDVCDQVYVVAARNIPTQRCPSQSATIIVPGGITSTPTVSGPLCGTTTEVSGTVNEQNGTQIQVFSNGVSVGTTTVSGGIWELTGLNIPAGAVVTAQATNTNGCESVSAISTGVTVGTQTTNVVSITQNPLIENNLVISGTGTNGDVVTLYIDNWPLYTSFNETTPASATVSGGAWSITLTQNTLYAGGTITALASNALTCLSLPQDQTPIVCLPPTATLVVNPDNSTICSGTAVTNVIIQNSQTGVIYQLYNSGLSANSGTSVMGNGGNITLTSAPISSSTTLTVLAFKSPFNGSCNQFLTENIPVSVVAVPTISYVSQSNPNCGLSDGSITISGLGNNLTYSVNYSLNGTATSGSYTSNASGQLVINNLGGGTYTNISTTAFGCNSTNSLAGPYSLTAPVVPAAPTASVTTQPTCTTPTGTIVVTAPTGANIQYSVNGTTYQVSGTFSGLAPGSYNVTAKDMSTGCVSSATALTVNAVPLCGPTANDNTTSTNEDTPVVLLSIQSNDTDADGNVVTSTIDLDPTTPGQQTTLTTANGTWTLNSTTGDVTFTPSANFNGAATITYTIQDNSGLTSNAANLTVIVNAVNDGPDAVNDVASTNEDTPVVIDVTNNDTDTDGAINDASVTIVSNPTNGTVSVNPTTGEVTYTPNPGFNGTDSFTYSVCDNGTPLPAQCDQATVTVTINAVNDPLVVDNDSNTITEDGGPATGDLTDTGDSDPDGTTLTVNTTPVDGPNNGTIIINADGTYSYTPNAGFNGNDTIVVSVCDNGSPLPTICVNDTLVITVTPVNDAPNANSDFANTNENISVTINVVNNDTDSDGNIDETTLTVVDQPTNGSVTVNTTTGQITYTPNNGFTGTDTLVYQICDNGSPLPALCDTAVVIVTVLPCGTDLTVDCDGDGVTNGDEIDPDGDGTPGPNGTDPNDPCSLTVANQTVAPSQVWLDADCDGDGATNGDEIDSDGDGNPGPNATDPIDPCSFDTQNQDLATVSQTWLDTDCDGDGVTNGNEIDPDGDGTPGPNGTNPSDSCSLNIADQSVAPSQAWLDADCDGDGVTNGDEIDGGSNPFDPCDPNSTLPGCSSGVVVPQAFTPDGDGTNDLFVITGIENYPQNKLTFYNRWGNEVFYAEGYSNDWDGTANRGIILGDGLLPTATYYYILDLNGDGSEILKGYVYIKR